MLSPDDGSVRLDHCKAQPEKSGVARRWCETMTKNNNSVQLETETPADVVAPARDFQYAHFTVAKFTSKADGTRQHRGSIIVAVPHDRNSAPQRLTGLGAAMKGLLNVDVDLVPGRGFEASIGSQSRIVMQAEDMKPLYQSTTNHVVQLFAAAKGFAGAGAKTLVVITPAPEDLNAKKQA